MIATNVFSVAAAALVGGFLIGISGLVKYDVAFCSCVGLGVWLALQTYFRACDLERCQRYDRNERERLEEDYHRSQKTIDEMAGALAQRLALPKDSVRYAYDRR